MRINQMSIAKLKTALAAIERCHIDAMDVNDSALDGETGLKPAMAATRKSLEASRAHLDDAHEIVAKLTKKPASDDDQELSYSTARRSSVLEKLDAAHVGRINRINRVGNVANRAAPLPPAGIDFGAYLVAQVREDELKRLRSMW
jgi:hypothetical protein